MGYAVIMFVILLLMAVTIALSANYGISKDSQEAPLLAENAYADRETEKAQSRLSIVNTCLQGDGGYTGKGGAVNYILWLNVFNNGSTVLNPNNSTIFYNLSYRVYTVTNNIGSSVPFGDVLMPLITSIVRVPNIYIGAPDANYQLRLMITASNGIKTIAPTAVNNFTGRSDKDNTTYSFTWSPSVDDTDIDYYILYAFKNQPINCPQKDYYTNFSIISGKLTASEMNESVACVGSCPQTYFNIVAVDTEGNMGLQSITLNCNPPVSGKTCTRDI